YRGAQLRRQVERLGLADRVVFTGALPPDQMPAVMHSIDLLVHPSLREGLPRTVPQALLSGTPVVAYDVDGTREAVIDGETGRLLAPGDIDGLARSILRAQSDPGSEGRLAQRGRERCRRMFPARRMVEELEGLYRSILERKTRGGQPR
ncbi:MAG: glycosyltransferase, partial [Planctomycetota bacterium]|nr:glycosyltransferase [Planctomycetota bacterium]